MYSGSHEQHLIGFGSVRFGFICNPASQIKQRTLSNDAYAYFSEIESKSYVPTGLNTYSSVGDVTFSYDGRANLTSDGSRTFAYDLENRLVSVRRYRIRNLHLRS